MLTWAIIKKSVIWQYVLFYILSKCILFPVNIIFVDKCFELYCDKYLVPLILRNK